MHSLKSFSAVYTAIEDGNGAERADVEKLAGSERDLKRRSERKDFTCSLNSISVGWWIFLLLLFFPEPASW